MKSRSRGEFASSLCYLFPFLFQYITPSWSIYIYIYIYIYISINLHYHKRINNVKNILCAHFLNLSWSFHFVLFLFLRKEFSLKGWLLLLLIWLKVFIFFSVLVFIFRWVLKVWLILKKYQINFIFLWFPIVLIY